MKSQAELGNLLAGLAALIRDMPADQFEKLVSGKQSFASRPKKKVGGKKKAARVKATPPYFGAGGDAVLSSLHSAPTRDDGDRILRETFPSKGRLVEFAKFLDLPIQQKDKAEKIRDKVVEFTVGRRLDGEAIRGGYTAK